MAANPVIINAVVEIMKYAFSKTNLKSKTTVASAAVAAGTTAAIQAGASPGSQVFPGDPGKAVIVDALFYVLSAVLFFYRKREGKDTS